MYIQRFASEIVLFQERNPARSLMEKANDALFKFCAFQNVLICLNLVSRYFRIQNLASILFSPECLASDECENSNWPWILRMKFRLRATVFTCHNLDLIQRTRRIINFQCEICICMKKECFLQHPVINSDKPGTSDRSRHIIGISFEISIKLHLKIATFLLSSEADNFQAKLSNITVCISSKEICIPGIVYINCNIQTIILFSPNGSNCKTVAWMT